MKIAIYPPTYNHMHVGAFLEDFISKSVALKIILEMASVSEVHIRAYLHDLQGSRLQSICVARRNLVRSTHATYKSDDTQSSIESGFYILPYIDNSDINPIFCQRVTRHQACRTCTDNKDVDMTLLAHGATRRIDTHVCGRYQELTRMMDVYGV